MVITVDKRSKHPLYKQIFDQIRRQILTGELHAGYQLLPERQMAESIGVNRTTVLAAYRELKTEGLVESHVGRGTVVAMAETPAVRPAHMKGEPIWEHMASDLARAMDDATIDMIMQAINRPGIISFAGGISSPDTQPLDMLRDLAGEHARVALTASPIGGFASLRKVMSDLMHARGCLCHPEEIMIVSGSQQGIDLVTRTLVNPGDIVFVEEPSYFPAIHCFQAAGARLMGIPMTPDGMDLDILEQLLHRYRPKCIYTVPTYHNPCACSMPAHNRVRLLELAYAHNVLVIEDDPYSELRYDGQSFASLKSMDTRRNVIYLSTFSKTVSPGLRLGWVCGHRKLINMLSSVKQYVDVSSSSLAQHVMERFITSGGMQAHIERMRAEDRIKRDAMAGALAKYSPSGASTRVPEGGSYIWYELPDQVTAGKVLAAASRAGVAVLPGTVFYMTKHAGERYLRLNFTFETTANILRGVKALCTAITDIQTAQDEDAGHGISTFTPID